jgi:hypothetical protein
MKIYTFLKKFADVLQDVFLQKVKRGKPVMLTASN